MGCEIGGGEGELTADCFDDAGEHRARVSGEGGLRVFGFGVSEQGYIDSGVVGVFRHASGGDLGSGASVGSSAPTTWIYLSPATMVSAAAPSLMAFARLARSKVPANGSRRLARRCMATAAMDSSTLPLAGVRILDMTRVLAGVRRE